MRACAEPARIMSFYAGKRVLVTGNSGFKGSWLTRMLLDAGAEVTGYSLCRPREYKLFDLSGLRVDSRLHQVVGDVRDLESLEKTFEEARPQVVLHLAAQPIVRTSYRDPVGTYATNVMGTVNLMECVRRAAERGDGVRSVVNVTTDKVYRNEEWCWGYREVDPLDGYDPYSNSKSCSELVTASYVRSFFSDGGVAVSTMRAGNVIGGGDFAPDRIVPDCVRVLDQALRTGEPVGEVVLRNPNSVRPYQHVLDPLFGYLMVAALQWDDASVAGSYNIGPRDEDCVTTERLVRTLATRWDAARSSTDASLPQLTVQANHVEGEPHEAGLLRLDCSKMRSRFGWEPRWNIEQALDEVACFTRAWLLGEDLAVAMGQQIRAFLGA